MPSITFLRDLPYHVISDDATEPAHLADLVTGTLMLNGWQLLQPIGPEGRRVQRGHNEINVDRMVPALYTQRYSLEHWNQTCTAAGVADVPLQIPDPLPREEDVNAARDNRARKVFLLVLLALAIVAAILGVSADRGDEAYVPPMDGTSRLPGGTASVHFDPHPNDWVESIPGNLNGIPNNDARWELGEYLSNGTANYTLTARIYTPAVDSPEMEKAWAEGWSGEFYRIYSERVEPRRTKLDGRPAWVWELDSKNPKFVMSWVVHSKERTWRIDCIAAQGPEAAAVERRCTSLAKSLKINAP